MRLIFTMRRHTRIIDSRERLFGKRGDAVVQIAHRDIELGEILPRHQPDHRRYASLVLLTDMHAVLVALREVRPNVGSMTQTLPRRPEPSTERRC